MSCNPALYVLNVLYILMASLFTIAMIYGMIIHIKDYKNSPHNGPKMMFISSMVYGIFGLLNTITYLTTAIDWISTCNEYKAIWFLAGMGLYVLQALWLLLTLFIRLYHVFLGSIYRLSKFTIILYITIFTALITLAIVLLVVPWGNIYGDDSYDVVILMFGIVYIVYIMSCVSISGLFIYKLFSLHKTVNHGSDGRRATSAEQNDRFIALITKNTVLAVIATSTTILSSLSVIIVPTNRTDTEAPILYIRHFSFLFDVFINYVCVKLAYKAFDEYYGKLCGSLDRKGKACCYRLTNGPDLDLQQAIRQQHHPNKEELATNSLAP